MLQPVLLLDIMDTLVWDPFFTELPRYFGMDLEKLYSLKDRQSYLDFEHGRITEAEHVATFFTDRRTVDVQEIKGLLRASYRWMEGVPELLDELKTKGHAMYALSNYSRWYQLIEEKLQVSRWVDWRFVSCQTGVRKPKPEAYSGAARALGVPEKDCLFIDDRQKNVDGALAVGMQGLLRTDDISTLRADLRELGVL